MQKKRREKVAVYIDGCNFFGYLKKKKTKLNRKRYFNYSKFVKFIIRNRVCESKRYYVGIVRNIDGSTKSRRMVKGQQKFISKIEKEGFIVKRGRIIYDSGKIREKGTDVNIAVDLIVGAVDNIYDTAILVSSDTDLIPAVKYVKYKRKG